MCLRTLARHRTLTPATARGKTYSVNFPLRDGIDDKSYQAVFKPIMQEIMDRFPLTHSAHRPKRREPR